MRPRPTGALRSAPQGSVGPRAKSEIRRNAPCAIDRSSPNARRRRRARTRGRVARALSRSTRRSIDPNPQAPARPSRDPMPPGPSHRHPLRAQADVAVIPAGSRRALAAADIDPLIALLRQIEARAAASEGLRNQAAAVLREYAAGRRPSVRKARTPRPHTNAPGTNLG
jgi:hypothetical protein